ncbi:MAG: type II toxin-antitoxin system VapC family toxin [Gammaproteobacteria bacterium]|nr:type II toxin-antitoxin system VapC family toxin [Gammaproteobacteria bacterium]
MILFCDTSALVKLYIAEPGSDITHEAARESQALAVSRIAWAEFHAALARRARLVAADEPALEQARAALASDWRHFLIIEVSQPVVELAGAHADLYALRAYDAVQLASADHLAAHAGKPVHFACFDRRLNNAAHARGMVCI